MYLEFAFLQGRIAHSLQISYAYGEAMHPASQKDLAERQLAQAVSMQGISADELAQRYGQSLRNAWQPDQSSGDK